MKSVDVAVVGGGIVGSVLAKGLAERAGLSVALIDAAPVSQSIAEVSKANALDFNPFTDTRVIALARRTVDELKALNVPLEKLADIYHGETPPSIDSIEVSDRGHLGLVNLAAEDYCIPSFGQVVSLSALTRLVASSSNDYEHIAPATVQSVTQHQNYTEVALDNGETRRAKLVVLADGGRSALAQQVGLTRTANDYEQTAIVFNVHTQQPHNNKAYERFTESGPLAFLPFDSDIDNQKSTGCGFSVVWTVKADKAEALLSMTNKAFVDALQDAFGFRQGKIIRVSDKASYPLSLKLVDEVTAHRTVVVGNAAQSLHPIAGQGFNLGLRDIYTLISTLQSERLNKSSVDKDGEFDPGQFNVLNTYAKKRKKDRAATITLTDTLVHTFSNQHFPLVVGRNVSLMALSMVPFAKKQFVKQTTGYGLGAR